MQCASLSAPIATAPYARFYKVSIPVFCSLRAYSELQQTRLLSSRGNCNTLGPLCSVRLQFQSDFYHLHLSFLVLSCLVRRQGILAQIA